MTSLGDAARAEGWDAPPPLLAIIAEALPALEAPRVAIVSRSADHALEKVLTRAVPGARVTVLPNSSTVADRHIELAARGPMDLIVDLARGPKARRRFREVFFHLRPGGTLVSRLPREETLDELVQELQALRSSGELHPPTTARERRTTRERDLHALAASVGRLELRGGFVVVENTVDTVAKVRDTEMDRYLALRPEAGERIDSIAGVDFESRCEVRSSAGPGSAPDLPHHIEALELSLRQHSGVTCLPRQIALQGDVVIPATFRHHAKERLRNAGLLDWAPDFARRPAYDARPLPGRFFYLDNRYRGHFGHALTDQISQLWGWQRAKDRFPDLRALLFERDGYPFAEWEYTLLEAGGIGRDDVHVASEPVEVETLVVASQMFSMPDFVHPEIVRTYQSVGDALEADSRLAEGASRIFCSRRGRRSGHNRDQIEQVFADAGFEVIHPEDHPLSDQVRLFRRADVLAGLAGSGMFQMAFAERPKHVILVGSESYTATNEYLIASVLGHRLDLVLCRPDVPQEDRFKPAAFHSNFTYDPDREGRFLAQVLEDL
ncbi:MAG TPA: glycosyltransferase 61 family protein [Nocardioides sp.]|nr:glycosyltransferase 61 family protein [Nocardioides sp.]